MDVSEEVKEILRLKALAKRYREESDRLKDEMRRKEAVVVEWLEDSGFKNIKTEFGSTAYLQEEIFCHVRKEDRGIWLDWLKENGFEDCIKPEIHHSTERAIVRERLANGQAIPECVNVSVKMSLGVKSNGYVPEVDF